MANSVEPADIDTFINNAAWAIHKTYHTMSKASPGAATIKQDSAMSHSQLTGKLKTKGFAKQITVKLRL